MPADSFRRLPIAVHGVLTDVPLHDVTVVDLPGGGAGRTLADLRALLSGGPATLGGPLTRWLFAFRARVGRVFRWDGHAQGAATDSYLHRVPEAIARRSAVMPGTRAGLFTVLYVLDDEALLEAKNRLVHAFLSAVLRPTREGYELYCAVYVQPISPWAGAYMAVIEPFRRFIVYPSILRGVRKAWRARYPIHVATSRQL